MEEYGMEMDEAFTKLPKSEFHCHVCGAVLELMRSGSGCGGIGNIFGCTNETCKAVFQNIGGWVSAEHDNLERIPYATRDQYSKKPIV